MWIPKTLENQSFINQINLSNVPFGKVNKNSRQGVIGWETYGGIYIIPQVLYTFTFRMLF